MNCQTIFLPARTSTTTAVMFNALAGPERSVTVDDAVGAESRVRIGVARNFTAETDITTAFKAAVRTTRTVAHDIASVNAPFGIPPIGDLHAIDADRKNIADRAFREVDLLLLPTTTTTVLTVDKARPTKQALSPAHTVFANYFGLPAITVPCGVDRNDLPIGLQIIGRPLDDQTVLRFARQFEAASGFATRLRPR